MIVTRPPGATTNGVNELITGVGNTVNGTSNTRPAVATVIGADPTTAVAGTTAVITVPSAFTVSDARTPPNRTTASAVKCVPEINTVAVRAAAVGDTGVSANTGVGSTVNEPELVAVADAGEPPVGAVTDTVPDTAPAGTTTVMTVSDTVTGIWATPPKLT